MSRPTVMMSDNIAIAVAATATATATDHIGISFRGTIHLRMYSLLNL